MQLALARARVMFVDMPIDAVAPTLACVGGIASGLLLVALVTGLATSACDRAREWLRGARRPGAVGELRRFPYR